MKDLLGLMGKAKEMQAKLQAMQEEIAGMEASGQAGGAGDSTSSSGLALGGASARSRVRRTAGRRPKMRRKDTRPTPAWARPPTRRRRPRGRAWRRAPCASACPPGG